CSCLVVCFFFSSRRRHTRFSRDWSSDVCSSDLGKTHLLASIFHSAPSPKAFGTFVELTHVVGALGFNKAVEELSSHSVLCIDERSAERRVGIECRWAELTAAYTKDIEVELIARS